MTLTKIFCSTTSQNPHDPRSLFVRERLWDSRRFVLDVIGLFSGFCCEFFFEGGIRDLRLGLGFKV